MSTCPECNKEFNPARWWQEFCCADCRQRWHRRKYRDERVERELAEQAEQEAQQESTAA